FLNAGAARVVQPDQRRANAHGHIHDLHDLGSVGLGERAAKHGKVLREDEDKTAFDAAITSDESVARKLLRLHSEIRAAMGDEAVGLLERAFVQQKLNALARRELAFLMLPRAPLRPAARLGGSVALLQIVELLFQIHEREIIEGRIVYTHLVPGGPPGFLFLN